MGRTTPPQTWNGSILSQSGMQACAGATDPVRLVGMLAAQHGPDDHSGSQSPWKGCGGSKAASPDKVSWASDM